jgi:hypothetical protein
VKLTACAPVEITAQDVPQSGDRLHGSARQVAEAIERFNQVGVEHLVLRFTAVRWQERKEQVNRLLEAISS